MRVSQYNQFRVLAKPSRDYGSLLASGAVVDVSVIASRTINAASVGIEVDTYERFVEWSARAMREHGVHLEQRDRLMTLIEAISPVGSRTKDGDFVCRVVDARGPDTRARRALFTLRGIKHNARQAWVIEAVKL
jgi:hypothetical protein